jgi:hypothetical protein
MERTGWEVFTKALGNEPVGGVYLKKGAKVVVASKVEDYGGEWVLDIPLNLGAPFGESSLTPQYSSLDLLVHNSLSRELVGVAVGGTCVDLDPEGNEDVVAQRSLTYFFDPCLCMSFLTLGSLDPGFIQSCPTKTPEHRHINPRPRSRKVSPEMQRGSQRP